MGRAKISRAARRARPVPLQDGYAQIAQEEEIEDNAAAAARLPFLDGDAVFLDSQTIGATGGTAEYRHKLGRTIKGWFFTRIHNAGGTVNGLVHESASDDETITLTNDATVDVDVAIAVY